MIAAAVGVSVMGRKRSCGEAYECVEAQEDEEEVP